MRFSRPRSLPLRLCAALLLLSPGGAALGSMLERGPGVHWVATWGASPAPQYADLATMARFHLLFRQETLREIVHPSIGGHEVRVRLSNLFGKSGVLIAAASIAAQGGGERALTFGGRSSITIPASGEVVSDPVPLEVPAGGDLAISLFLPGTVEAAGIHYAATQTSYAEAGDRTGDPEWPAAGRKLTSWAFLEGVDVEAPRSAAAIVAFGDSITDGAHSTRNANARWPDDLARRLLAAGGPERGVVNSGIGGNRILHDAEPKLVAFGVNALARYDRDVLAEPGVRYVIVLEGINDIGHPGNSAPRSESVTAADLIAGLTQLIERAHERGLKVFAGTLTPFEGAAGGYYTPEKEKVREAYNAWIRSTPLLDGYVDFDRVTRDPADPRRYLPAYDSGDHLHPDDAGYRAMAQAIDLGWFR